LRRGIKPDFANKVPVIHGRRNRKKSIEYDKEKYKKRGLMERIFANPLVGGKGMV
jgi:hypothetical protein